MTIQVKNFCKDYNIKFEKNTNFGFIASIKTPIKAGMQKDLISNKIISTPIKKIGYRKVYFDMHIIDIQDISFGKSYKNSHPLIN